MPELDRSWRASQKLDTSQSPDFGVRKDWGSPAIPGRHPYIPAFASSRVFEKAGGNHP